MDDQNSNPGGNAPSEPTVPSAPQPEQKCTACGGSASGNVCSACGQGEVSCTCQPSAAPTGDQGGPAEGGSPPSEPGGNPPVV